MVFLPMATLNSQTLSPEKITTPAHFDVSKNMARVKSTLILGRIVDADSVFVFVLSFEEYV